MFDKTQPYNDLPLLPGNFEYDKKEFLKLAIKASEEISRLNGLMHLVPNTDILVSPLLIKESVESSSIENINTTTMKVLQSKALPEQMIKGPEKEVLHYHSAILSGYDRLKKEGGIGFNFIVELHDLIEPTKIGIRKIPGTIIANGYGETLYTPPIGDDIVRLLTNLEKFINNFEDDIDALIKMPIVHYQFESIHPFYDGNGRTGRVLNVLYLVLAKKLDFPILFLSEYINNNRKQYYELLSKTTATGDYSEFVIYLLKGVISQSRATCDKIIKIRDLMLEVEDKISKLKLDYHKITFLLFSYPFLSISDFKDKLSVTKNTIIRNIKKLEEAGIISSVRIGKNKLIFIKEFIELLN